MVMEAVEKGKQGEGMSLVGVGLSSMEKLLEHCGCMQSVFLTPWDISMIHLGLRNAQNLVRMVTVDIWSLFSRGGTCGPQGGEVVVLNSQSHYQGAVSRNGSTVLF